jgi:hypothetical protein
MKLITKTIISTFVGLVILAYMPLSYASCNGYSCKNTIYKIVNWDRDYVNIRLTDDELPSNCNSSLYYSLSHSHKNFKQIYAALLAAKFTNSIVSLRTVDGSDNCAISYIVVD